VSQRAAQLSKRRAEVAAVTSAPAPPESDEEEATPEVFFHLTKYFIEEETNAAVLYNIIC